MSLIELRDVSHCYPGTGHHTPVLSNINLRLTERRIAVIGGNGSGKSTFARLLNGLVIPAAGRVLIDGLDTRTEAKAIRRKVGFLFTNPDAQIVMPTVAEDIAFGLRPQRLSRTAVHARVDAAMRTYNLVSRRDHPAHLLSGGQKQLLALASVLVTEPQVVVMDEPTTLLDLANARRVADTIARLPEQVILVTHDLDLVPTFDRALVLHAGQLAFDGDPADAVAHYRGLLR